MDKEQTRNLILATVISLAILLVFTQLGPKVKPTPQQPAPPTQTEQVAPPPAIAPLKPRSEALAASPRVAIDTPRLRGSINLKGARLDDLTLKDYHQTIAPDSPEVALLSPDGARSLPEGAKTPEEGKPEDVEKSAENPYFVDFGWAAQGNAEVKLPTQDATWKASGERLTPQQPLDLTWENGDGLRFAYHYAIDDNYMFTITASVENGTDQPVTLVPKASLSRRGLPPVAGSYILHEGPIGVLDGSVQEIKYANLRPAKTEEYKSSGGWFGITDKYWLAAFIPDQKEAITARFSSSGPDKNELFLVQSSGGERTIAPHDRITTEEHFFAGAKEVHLLDAYASALGIPKFDRAIDFGWFYPITRSMFLVLDYFSRHLFAGFVGSFGFAILLLTLLVKLLFFPLANKSYRAMSKMKALAPEMQKLRERFPDDRARVNQEMMALYKREGANPMAGCLPIFVQIPVFFSLYKVLYVNIEMWHAPFYFWIHDLSARDPTTVFNLFGLLPFPVPDYLFNTIPLQIGVWPLIMGVTMFLQQKLNPPPPDPVQARMFMLMPVIFTFMMAQFAAGLVIYWTWNNLLSIAQQWTIMRRAGVARKPKPAA